MGNGPTEHPNLLQMESFSYGCAIVGGSADTRAYCIYAAVQHDAFGLLSMSLGHAGDLPSYPNLLSML